MASNAALPSQMRAANILEYNKPYALGERPLPSIGDTDILVRVHAAGFCHSDLQALQGEFEKPAPIGLIPSHEIAGVVAKLGSKYEGDLKVNDRVGVLNFKHACGSCVGCRLTQKRGEDLDPRFCDKRETAGFLHDGGFAEYASADPETTVKLPGSISFEQAAPLTCAGATVWGSLEGATTGLAKGETVAIVGIGGLGHLGVQFAKALGFKVIAVDSREAGRQLASDVENPALKPDLIVDSSNTAAASKAIYGFTDGEGLAAAVVCTPSLEANRWALNILRVKGTLGILGLPQNPWQFDAAPIVFRELTIKGSYVAGRAATERMMKVVEEAGVRSHLTVLPFEQIPGIVEIYEDAAFKGRIVVQI
ncbi:alcohol dehydrogenase [Fusarium circinatum]|uniref:Alcohol dehydrogenase n=1 Tax=Fusarium circinatum TaxID=48490 RepID=A0A8H5U4Q2_FUSCI|nr:alcohol dehydrogenase [Fusarium circinatum]